ncbi:MULTISPECIES: reverse transcriptase domain-containing protein [unclassified Peribacillus]|uniref:reverse transcriptase domain-containing protein n=1 Tax=unclassified Peribacillus TaxID=2675266 RepID=UPI00366CF260
MVKVHSQGGVISPLLANVYLMKWIGNGICMEYALFVMRMTFYFLPNQKHIKEAAYITKEKLKELGLEVSKEKTKVINFQKDNLDFLGFTFHHWREGRKDKKSVFHVTPKKEPIKDFRL